MSDYDDNSTDSEYDNDEQLLAEWNRLKLQKEQEAKKPKKVKEIVPKLKKNGEIDHRSITGRLTIKKAQLEHKKNLAVKKVAPIQHEEEPEEMILFKKGKKSNSNIMPSYTNDQPMINNIRGSTFDTEMFKEIYDLKHKQQQLLEKQEKLQQKLKKEKQEKQVRQQEPVQPVVPPVVQRAITPEEYMKQQKIKELIKKINP